MKNDYISRQAAIDALTKDYYYHDEDYMTAISVINALPSAQPDWNEMLVICDNCGHAIHVKRLAKQKGGKKDE